MNSTFFIILVFASLIILGIILILLGLIAYRQHLQIRKQSQQIKSLRKKSQPQKFDITKTNEKAEIILALKENESRQKEISSASQETNRIRKSIRRRYAIQEKGSVSSQILINSVEKQLAHINFKAEDDLIITDEFKHGLTMLNGDSPCIFITGKAGAGKSRLLQLFVAETRKKIVVLAPTGMAALRVGGQTIHSFFGFPAKLLTEKDIKPSQKRELYRALDVIIIDEISMVRADLLDNIDKFLRLNGKDSQKPFGGIQMIFFGDLYQLPPVISNEDENKYLSTKYPGSFFFNANIMQEVPMDTLELTQVFRQKDENFIRALNMIRINNISQEILDYINQRHYPIQSKARNNNFISLVSTNKSANWINNEELAKIQSPTNTYVAMIEGEFTKKSMARSFT